MGDLAPLPAAAPAPPPCRRPRFQLRVVSAYPKRVCHKKAPRKCDQHTTAFAAFQVRACRAVLKSSTLADNLTSIVMT